MGEERLDRITNKVLSECNIYPPPDREKIRNEIKKINRLFEGQNKGISEKRLINKVSKSFELKRRINSDQWIFYDGKLSRLER